MLEKLYNLNTKVYLIEYLTTRRCIELLSIIHVYGSSVRQESFNYQFGLTRQRLNPGTYRHEPNSPPQGYCAGKCIFFMLYTRQTKDYKSRLVK